MLAMLFRILIFFGEFLVCNVSVCVCVCACVRVGGEWVGGKQCMRVFCVCCAEVSGHTITV